MLAEIQRNQAILQAAREDTRTAAEFIPEYQEIRKTLESYLLTAVPETEEENFVREAPDQIKWETALVINQTETDNIYTIQLRSSYSIFKGSPLTHEEASQCLSRSILYVTLSSQDGFSVSRMLYPISSLRDYPSEELVRTKQSLLLLNDVIQLLRDGNIVKDTPHPTDSD